MGCGFLSGVVQILKVPNLTQIHKLNLCQSSVNFLAFTINAKLVASVFSENMLIVKSMKNNKTVYVERNIKVKCAVFCLSNNSLVYSMSQSIVVIDKNYIKVAVLNNKSHADFLFLSRNNRTILVTALNQDGVA